MNHRVYTMTEEAWNKGTDWDAAIAENEIETVAEFETLEEAIEYYENDLGGDTDRYGVE